MSNKRKQGFYQSLGDDFFVCSYREQGCNYNISVCKRIKYENDELNIIMQQLENKLSCNDNKNIILKAFEMCIHEQIHHNNDKIDFDDTFIDEFISNKYTNYVHVYKKKHFCSYGNIKGDQSYKCLFVSTNSNVLNWHEKKCPHRTFCEKCNVSYSLLNLNCTKDEHEKQCNGLSFLQKQEELYLQKELNKWENEYMSLDTKHFIHDKIQNYESVLLYIELSNRSSTSDIDFDFDFDNQIEINHDSIENKIFLVLHKIRESKKIVLEKKNIYCEYCQTYIESDDLGIHAEICEEYQKKEKHWNNKIVNIDDQIENNTLQVEIMDTLEALGYIQQFFGVFDIQLTRYYLNERNKQELIYIRNVVVDFEKCTNNLNYVLLKKIICFDTYYLRSLILYNFYIYEEIQTKYLEMLKDINTFNEIKMIDIILEMKNNITLCILRDKMDSYYKLSKLFFQLIYGCTEKDLKKLDSYIDVDCLFNVNDAKDEKIERNIQSCNNILIKQKKKMKGICKYGCDFKDKKNMSRHYKSCALRPNCIYCKMNFSINGKITQKEKHKHEIFCKNHFYNKQENQKLYEKMTNLHILILKQIEKRSCFLKYWNRDLPCFHCNKCFHSYDDHFRVCIRKYPSKMKTPVNYLEKLLDIYMKEIEFYHEYSKQDTYNCNICHIRYNKRLDVLHQQKCNRKNIFDRKVNFIIGDGKVNEVIKIDKNKIYQLYMKEDYFFVINGVNVSNIGLEVFWQIKILNDWSQLTIAETLNLTDEYLNTRIRALITISGVSGPNIVEDKFYTEELQIINNSRDNNAWYVHEIINENDIILRCNDCQIDYPLNKKEIHDKICSSWYKKIFGKVSNDSSKQSIFQKKYIEKEKFKIISDIKFYRKYYSFFMKDDKNLQSYFVDNWESKYPLYSIPNEISLTSIVKIINKHQDIHRHALVLLVNIFYNIFLKKDTHNYQHLQDINENDSYENLYKIANKIIGFEHKSFSTSNYSVIQNKKLNYLASLKCILRVVAFQVEEKDWQWLKRCKDSRYEIIFDKNYVYRIFEKPAEEVVHVYQNIFHKRLCSGTFIKLKNMDVLREIAIKEKQKKNKAKSNDTIPSDHNIWYRRLLNKINK